MLTIKNTNNDAVIKLVSSNILISGSKEYTNVDEVDNSSIIKRLFFLPFVKKVFVSANFIAVERYKIVEWAEVQDQLNEMISNHLSETGSLFDKVEEKKEKYVAQLYVESTPNPGVSKYVCNKFLTKQPIQLLKEEDASQVPIAKELFEIGGINEVFIADNYISIGKNPEIEWFEITNEIRETIRIYLQSEKSIVTSNYVPKNEFTQESNNVAFADLDDVSKEIISVLNEYIKPAVTADGGNIMFESYNAISKEVQVILQGACSGCPSSTITLKNGIEATLKQVLPNKINSVIAING